MNRALLATVITVAVAVFIGQLVYKRVFEPALATRLKEETKGPEHRMTVNEFLDNF